MWSVARETKMMSVLLIQTCWRGIAAFFSIFFKTFSPFVYVNGKEAPLWDICELSFVIFLENGKSLSGIASFR